MLIKRILLHWVLSCAIGVALMAQNTALTLEDAIVKQGTELAPENMEQLTWVKGEDAYAFVETREADYHLMVRKVGEKAAVKITTLSSINEQMKAQGKGSMNKMPTVNWLNNHEIYFVYKGAYFLYELDKRQLTSLENEIRKTDHFDLEPGQRHLAYTSANNLYIKLFDGEVREVTHETDTEIVCGQAVHRFEFGISKGTFWSPGGNYLAFYRNDQREVGNYPLVDTEVKPAALKQVKYPMAGTSNEKVTIGVYELKSGNTHYLKTGEGFDYLTNISWGPEGKYIYVALLNRDQNHMKLNRYDAATGELVKTLFEEKDEKYVEPLHPVIFTGDKEGTFLWHSQRDGYMHLYHYNFEGNLIKQVSSGKWEVKEFLGLSQDAAYAFVEGTGENATETYLYKVDLKNASAVQLPGEPGVHKGQLSGSGTYLIDDYSSIIVPHKINLINTKGTVMRKLLEAKNPLAGMKIGKAEIFSIGSGEEVPLHCRLIKPSGFEENKKYPVVVYVYNGPHVQLVRNSWLASAPLWMYYLAEKGYLVFTVDGRGSANRGLEFEQATFRQLGSVEIEDQMRGVEYLKNIPSVDAGRMAVHGWSYGGFMTVSLMLKRPGVFKAGVAGGPVIDWKFYEIMYTERYMDTPAQNKDGYEQASLLNYVDQLEGSLLTIHGLQDDVVVPQHNLAFIRKCVESGVQTDFFPYPTHPHNVRGKDRVHLMQKVIDYIEEKL